MTPEGRMDILVSLNLGKDYIDDLKKRLKKAGITYGELAREMSRLSGNTIGTPQISRWMHKRVRPNLTSVELIEAAYARLSKVTGA
jgi:transcriptional regulator with XRE-family HTH domain